MACGYDGPPLPEATPTLLAARQFVLERDARSRQLDDARARALSQNAPLLFAVLFVLASVPLTYELVTTLPTLLDWSGRNQTYGGAVLAFVLFIGIWIFGVRAFFRVKSAQARLRAACAALPPERKGEPARCRVCGGPLPAGAAVVRCPFCATDNFSDPAALDTLEERETSDVLGYEFAVTRAEALTQSVTFSEQTRALVFAVGVPLVALWPMATLTQILLRIPLPVNARVRYELAMTREGECVERASGDSGFALSELVGKRVHAQENGQPFIGVVDHVHGTVLGNIAVVADDGYPHRLDPRSLCIIVPEPNASKKPTTVFAADDTAVYFPDMGGIFSAPPRNLSATMPDLESVMPVPVGMMTRGDALYFDDGSLLFRRDRPLAPPAFVGRIPFGRMTLAASSSSPSKTIFSFVAEPPAVYAFDLTSASPSAVRLDTDLDSIVAIASDGDDVFVAGNDARGPAVIRAHLGALAERWLAASCQVIAVDTQSLVCGDHSSISSYARSTATRRVLFELPPQTVAPPENENIDAIALDARNVYFSYDRTSTRAENGFIAEVSRVGGTAHVIAMGMPRLGSHMVVRAHDVVT
ncbi:MAG: hypothetical protein ABI551_25625, partial [Polyangiaceae bacterium]